jgi:uncharacterized protein (TIGR02271 family)
MENGAARRYTGRASESPTLNVLTSMNRDRSSKSDKTTNPNRDPLTHESGSHPVGTGLGAAAGGTAGVGAAAATGAAIGTGAGPVGTGIGAAVGAVAGGLAGKAIAEHANPTDDVAAGSQLERYLDYTVVDRDDRKVGSVDAVWADSSGEPAYVGIKTGWLGLGRAHLVPSHALQVSESTRKLRLPYTAEVVKGAPSFDSQNEIDAAAEREIEEYYRNYGYAAGSSATTGLSEDQRRTERADTTRTEEEVRVPLRAEELKVGKREVEYGGVRLRKIIRTETVNQPVELQREEIVVERVPAQDRTPSRTDIAFREEEVYVPLRREEAVVEKTAHTTEEVRVGKRRETEQRQINETVRREDVEIEKRGSTDDRRT